METPACGTPAFEDIDPTTDCDCSGCALQRLNPGARPAPTGHRAAAAVVVAATSAALTAGPVAPALAAPHSPARPGVPAGDEPETPQGDKAPLHGPAGGPVNPSDTPPVPTPAAVKIPATTRADIIRRAKTWVAAKVPYSMTAYWSDGYRQDCSGFVSMAWNLPGNEWTGTLDKYGTRIPKEELQPGDILLFHNPADPQKGSHVTIFGGWTDYTHSYYFAYEQTRPGTRHQATPYAYWSHSDHYVAYRYQGVTADTAGTEGAEGTTDAAGPGSPPGPGSPAGPAAPGPGESGNEKPASTDNEKPGSTDPKETVRFPGRSSFGPGVSNAYVTQLGRMLVERGAKRFYRVGPGPRWSEADRRATQAFQQAQGWRGADADGLPGPRTWALLVGGQGRDIAPGTAGTPVPAPKAPTPTATPSARAPAFPGRAMFRPGANNAHVTQLGKQLVKKGYGRYYTLGPGPRWGAADRRAVEAFQRAQGWRGAAADGYPGPETWRRLFS
ncbi:peptidoglycan-binding protein [Streptomyces sp. NPDC018693]|uniref:peptidoglycan-binding protein n=1 Tax=unclassified Streptomyces TaxID=2593676 RepID=UPI00379D1D17